VDLVVLILIRKKFSACSLVVDSQAVIHLVAMVAEADKELFLTSEEVMTDLDSEDLLELRDILSVASLIRF
jgi:hypothetical protein